MSYRLSFNKIECFPVILKNNCFKIAVKGVKVRKIRTMPSKLEFSKFGTASSVVKKIKEKMTTEVEPTDVLVRILASPVNPVDINTIEGSYHITPFLPAIPGTEGVAEVVRTGKSVKNLSVGDHVIPLDPFMGMWRTYAKFPADSLYKVPKNLDLIQAATLTINPCTAYRMLKEFINLEPGDVVIQNGANSAVGQYVIQLARMMGVKTVNIVRDRPTIEHLKSYLQKLGATVTFTEEEIKSTNIFQTELSKPKIAFNCVGGESASNLLRYVDYGGIMVTYGGMSKKPVVVSTSALVFKDISLKGFSVYRWESNEMNCKERFDMFNDIITMMLKKQLVAPKYNIIPYDEYKLALDKTLRSDGKEKKYILKFGMNSNM